MPKHPIVLAHGLFGFAELKLAGSYLPAIHYWHGIKDALVANGAEVITAVVPPSGSIEERAAQLRRNILAASHGRPVNIIAHSMGGLDARYMISRSRQKRSAAAAAHAHEGNGNAAGEHPQNDVNVRALVTISTPHRGSVFADYIFDQISPNMLPTIYEVWEKTTGLGTGAFAQLTHKYMEEEFNPRVTDDPDVRYFSYGAALKKKPPLLSPFRRSYKVVLQEDGPNDGLVSVNSAKWGQYKGTLEGVSHLDLINWTNLLRGTLRKWMGEPVP